MKHGKGKSLSLGIILICMLGLTACGDGRVYNTVAGSRYDESTFTRETLQLVSGNIEDNWFENWCVQGITPENFEEVLYDSIYGSFGSDDMYNAIAKGYRSWFAAKEDLGYDSLFTLPDDINVTNVQYYINKDGVLTVEARLKGSGPKAHTAVMEYTLNRDGMPTSIVVNVDRSLGEKLTNAGLNTLLGMGMAFFVLIIVSLVISLFPLFIGTGEKKKKAPSDKEITQAAMDNTLSMIADKEEAMDTGDELAAVIAAAVAAYEADMNTGAVPTGSSGYYVRSIRKVGRQSNWKNH